MLRASEEKFSSSFYAAPVSMAISSLEEGILLEVNEAFERLSGYKSGEVIGRTAMELGFWHDPRERQEMVSLLLKEREVLVRETTFLDKNGKCRTGLFSCVVIEWHGEKRLLKQIQDIPARKQTEAGVRKTYDELELRVLERTAGLLKTNEALELKISEREAAILRLNRLYLESELALHAETMERLRAVAALREKEQQFMQQSRQATMGEMIGHIAHQWRQPLNTLGLVVQQLHLDYEQSELFKAHLDNSAAIIMDIIQHMSRTIDDFRNFFRPDKEKVTFNVLKQISKTLSLVEAVFKEQRIAIEVDPSGDPVIYGHPNEYSQALLNILINARDAFLRQKIDKPKVTINLTTAEGNSVVTITDNAGGIPEEILDKIFDPYFTTKGPEKGTGVGLFMSKIIIEKSMNGSLSARSVCNGAEFRIEV